MKFRSAKFRTGMFESGTMESIAKLSSEFLLSAMLVGVGAQVFCAQPAAAQVLVDHQALDAPGKIDVAPVLSFSSIEYEGDSRGGAEIERTILGLSAGYGLSPDLNAFGELGYSVESSFEDGGDDDDGFILGTGLRGVIARQDKLSLRGYGGLRYINEEYGGDSKGNLFEVYGGLVARGQVRQEIGLYLGIDIVPFSDGEIESGNREFDIERDDLIGLRLGGDYAIKGIVLSAEFPLISEEGFTFRVNFPL